MAVASRPASRDPQPRRRDGFQINWTAILFLAPAALLLLVFLVFPALFTVGLSFDRGRGGEFSEFVGLRNYINLFTNDPNFLRSEEHTSELQSRLHLVCRLLLEKKKSK